MFTCVLQATDSGLRSLVLALYDVAVHARRFQSRDPVDTASIRLLLNVDSADDTAMERTLDAIRQVGAEAKSDSTEVALSRLPLPREGEAGTMSSSS